MKVTMDYMVGNTAIQIINTGKRIKVIDVEREELKKYLVSRILTFLICGALIFVSCSYIVGMRSAEEVLDKQVYALESEIEQLKKENIILQKENEENVPDFEKVYKKAKKLGMVFPTVGQVFDYKADKNTPVKINSLDGLVQ